MTKSKDTLIILTPAFPKDEADTIWVAPKQVFIRAMNRCFPHLSVVILTFQFPASHKPYRWYGNEVIPFNGRLKGKLHRLLLWRRVWRQLKQLQRTRSILGLYSFWCGECAFVGKQFSRRFEIPHFTWISGQDAQQGNLYAQWMASRAGQLIAMSDFLQVEFYRNHHIQPAHVIPIGIDPALFGAPPATKDIDIIGVGSLIALKQYDVLIRVVKQLTAYYPSLRALLCGDGPQREYLALLIRQSGLEKNIELMGITPQPEVLALMQRSKILLHPSSYEGFGSVCIEALYAGAHVISFVKPMQQVIPHWHTLDTEAEMMEKALALLQDPATDYTSVAPYTMDAAAKAVMQLFTNSHPAVCG